MSIIGLTISYEKYIKGEEALVKAVVIEKFRDGGSDGQPGGDGYLVRLVGKSDADTITPYQIRHIHN